MTRSICLCFQVHQPYRLRTYRFFNIGHDHQYYDDYQNRHIIRRIAEKSYIPANKLMLDLIHEYGAAFRVSYAISGPALEQLQQYAPEVIEGFKKLAATGSVEFIGESYSHSLSSLASKEEFTAQIIKHRERIEELFGQTTTSFLNTEMIYSDQIGQDVSELGFNTMLTEGAKHILGWKSPNFSYVNAINPKMKLLLRNFRLSDDIIFKFSNKTWAEWPLTAEKYAGWLKEVNPKEEVVNLFMNYETLGEQQSNESGIFDFFRHLPAAVFSKTNFKFATPRDLYDKLQPIAAISVQYPISWADEEKDLTAWLGNELQDEAFQSVYSIASKVRNLNRRDITRDWERLQTSDHFYYMCTKWFSDGEVHKYFNPYASPYDAFINYMNVLSDLMIRIDEDIPEVAEVAEPAKKLVKKTEPAVKPAVKKAVKKTVKKETGKTAAKTKKVNKPVEKIRFAEIASLSDLKIKGIIKSMEIEDLFVALKGAGEEVRSKFEKNLGKRGVKQFEELGTTLKGIKSTDVTRQRKLIEEKLNTTKK